MGKNTAPGYPVMLHLNSKRCAVIGGGKVAARKIAGLLEAGAQVTVISPVLDSGVDRDQVQHIAAEYDRAKLVKIAPFLVIAATDQPDVNRLAIQDAREIGILASAVDANGIYGDAGDFDNMAVSRHDPIRIAISTGGASPALTVHLNDAIHALIGEHYPTLARWLGELRPRVLAEIPDAKIRRAFWRHVIDSDVIDLLRSGSEDEAHARLLDLFNTTVKSEGVQS